VASSAAKRYAQAVLGLAKEQGTLDAWHADLTQLNALISDPGAKGFFGSPSVSAEEKAAKLDRSLAPSQPEVRNLAHLLLKRGRIGIVPQLFELFEDGLRAERGIAVANVTTAEPLGPGEQSMVRERLSRMLGKQVELRLSVDPAIIGGIVVRVGDLLVDGSVVSKLRRLRARLAAA